jgi:hypothetical protein
MIMEKAGIQRLMLFAADAVRPYRYQLDIGEMKDTWRDAAV